MVSSIYKELTDGLSGDRDSQNDRVREKDDSGKVPAREMRASGIAVTLVVHEHKRFGRGSAVSSGQIKKHDIGRRVLDRSWVHRSAPMWAWTGPHG
ncbi:hypothetical protein [Streptosporangium sp. NBC_01756]|uniref:hypothetical protein n=1 Tax=Streptosporangium sp. NBC_01756 TaxID=2975950 RepID=UPI002DD9BD41|nr:hypothetical protein [Streptosporangium sp. NBC_01756]WSC86527.1 hypothetical protein OIE48_40325 [Streptosporangium sp. NBC_01756]